MLLFFSSGYFVPVLLVHHFNHPVNGQTLLKPVSDKVFRLFGAAGHVTGAVDQKEFAAPAAGTPEIGSHQLDLAFNGRVAAGTAYKIRGSGAQA
jgi:hypothetical protein